MYTDCDSLLTKSTWRHPETSLMESAAAGVDLNRIVVGKPGIAADANDGFMNPFQLAKCVKQGEDDGWTGGGAL